MICLRWKKNTITKVCMFFLVIILICSSGYLASYLRYNDRDIVDVEAIKLQNKLLKEKLSEVENLNAKEGDFIIGKVVFRNMHDFYNEVIIDLGTIDGVEIGSAVLNSEGLIGIVYKVEREKAFVKLLSGNYNVSVKINETYGNLNNGIITLLNKYAGISVGDKVYTSNYGGVQSDIYIGEVTEIIMDNNGLGQEAKVKLIDNNNLNYISVMVNVS